MSRKDTKFLVTTEMGVNVWEKLACSRPTHPLEKNDHSHHMSNATEMIIAIIPESKLRGYRAQKKSTWCTSTNIFKYIQRYMHIKKHMVNKWSIVLSGVRVVKWSGKSSMS